MSQLNINNISANAIANIKDIGSKHALLSRRDGLMALAIQLERKLDDTDLSKGHRTILMHEYSLVCELLEVIINHTTYWEDYN